MNVSQVSGDLSDWTQGKPQIHYQVCAACSSSWYFARSFCPACGVPAPLRQVATGLGTVYAATVVHRAPSPGLAMYTPYTLLLVDAAEGFRLMAHGDAGLTIGDWVQASFRAFGHAFVPHFLKA